MAKERVNRVVYFKDLRDKVPYTDPGQRFNDVYKLTVEDDGTEKLVVCGKVDTYEMIQSYADSCDLKAIIERCTRSGDYSELYKTEGFYADMTIVPKTRSEALQAFAEAENVWNKLPKEAKEKFDNDVNKFFASAFTDEWFKKLEIPQKEDEGAYRTNEGIVREGEMNE